MPRFYFDSDELYPYYFETSEQRREWCMEAELSAEEIADYREVERRMQAWQERLGELAEQWARR